MLTSHVVAEMIRAAEDKATDLGVPSSVAVVDEGGNLKAFSRMDGAVLGSADAARRKAYTSAVSGLSTATWFGLANDDPTYGMLTGLGMDGVLFLPGGEPLLVDGAHAGGVGVSGGLPDQDVEILAAAIAVASVE